VLRLTTLALTLFGTQLANADSNELRLKEKVCGENSSYRIISGCFSSLYKEADQELNAQHKELIDYLDQKNKQNLVNAQRLWIKFRNADCLFLEPREGDDYLTTSGRNICLTRRTLDRLEQLEEYNFDKGCNGCSW
jgi:uncharacterized protein YecT (DUF1311 family)